jgi:hypothetical protein
MLDTSFLVATILVIITLLFYILYWGRFLALLIGLSLRVVLWNRGGSSVWIQIGASLLTLPLHFTDPCVRLLPCIASGGPHSTQGFSLPFKQPDLQDCQSPAALAILDSVPYPL